MTVKRPTARHKDSSTADVVEVRDQQFDATPVAEALVTCEQSLLSPADGEVKSEQSSSPMPELEEQIFADSRELAGGMLLGGVTAIHATHEEPAEPSDWSQNILDHCCARLGKHHGAYLRAAISGIQHALAAGNYVLVIKSTVGHRQFRSYCEQAIPGISFRRIEQYAWLAERKDQLLETARDAQAQRGAPLADDEILASLSFRKAQRILSGKLLDSDQAEQQPKSRRKSRRTAIDDNHREQWLTPEDIVTASWQLMGGIELDPAAGNNPHLAHVPRCVRPEEDGLAPGVPWSGSVFLHPPIKRIGEWVSRCKIEFTGGNVREAVLLVPALTDSPWFLAVAAFAKGFLRQRPQFSLPRRLTPQVADLPYVVIHLARDDERQDRFAAAFGELADVHLPFAVR